MTYPPHDPVFVIRAYRKADLAHLYHPTMPLTAAMYKLRGWIRRNHDLYAALYSAGEGKNDHHYTRRQVKLIVEYLGEP